MQPPVFKGLVLFSGEGEKVIPENTIGRYFYAILGRGRLRGLAYISAFISRTWEIEGNGEVHRKKRSWRGEP